MTNLIGVAIKKVTSGIGAIKRMRHGLPPEYVNSKFESSESAYNPRDSESKLNVPLPRTHNYKNSSSYSGAILWNSLPCD